MKEIEVIFIEYFLASVYIIAAWALVSSVQNKRIETYWYYSIYKKAFLFRVFGAICFGLMYFTTFGDGDAVYYFKGARNICMLSLNDLKAGMQVFLGDRSPELRSLFDWTTGQPAYWKDANSWTVCRLMAPFYAVSGGSYFSTALLMNVFMFKIFWDFYIMLRNKYPSMQKQIGVSLFFIPSLIYWSSGVLKDVWCLAGVSVMYMCIYYIFIKKRVFFRFFILYIFWAYVIFSIRPFMFYTAFATTILWIGFIWLKKIESAGLRNFALPFVIVVFSAGIIFSVSRLGNVAEGKYATVNSMLEQAVVIQSDLTRDQYGENSFDIGSFDASLGSQLAKAPQALLAGFFRPFLWEARTFFTLLSALENTFLLGLFLYVLYRSKFLGFFRIIKDDEFLLSIFIYVLILAFFMGLTIANFGALVRYKIAILPFFLIILFRVNFVIQTEKRKADFEGFLEI